MRKVFLILFVFAFSVYGQTTFRKSKYKTVVYNDSYEQADSWANIDSSAYQVNLLSTGKIELTIYDEAGSVTFQVDSLGGIDATNIDLDSIKVGGEWFTEIKKIGSYLAFISTGDTTWAMVDTTDVGDITGVTAGDFLDGGGASGAVTINADTSASGLLTRFDTDFVPDSSATTDFSAAEDLNASGGVDGALIEPDSVAASGGATFGGNVGMGISPNTSRNFSVRDTTDLVVEFETATVGGGDADLEFTLDAPSSEKVDFVFKSDNSYKWRLRRNNGNDNFIIYSDSQSENAFVIEDATGDVGIGESSPSTKLDVNGGATADSLQIADGIFVNNWFQSTSGDSVGVVWYNTVAARNDTVWMIQ
jgi:hypothetical protein